MECSVCHFCTSNYRLPNTLEDESEAPKKGIQDSPSPSEGSSDDESWDEGSSKRPRLEEMPVLPLQREDVSDKWDNLCEMCPEMEKG